MDNNLKIVKIGSQVRYRGMHDVIALIAKDQRCSMNKARKIYTRMCKSGYIMFYLSSLISFNKNKRIYSEELLKRIRDSPARITNDIEDILTPIERFMPNENALADSNGKFKWIGELDHPQSSQVKKWRNKNGNI